MRRFLERQKQLEPVVHSSKWTTGSRLFGVFTGFPPFSQVASGPLFKVDHWLTPFLSNCPVSAFSVPPTPLPVSKVYHLSKDIADFLGGFFGAAADPEVDDAFD